VLVIAAFAFAHWDDLRPSPHASALAWAPGVVALGAIAACQCLAMLAGRAMDRGGMRAHDAAQRSSLIGAALVTMAIGCGVQWWGWDALVRGWIGDVVLVDEVAIASPLLVTILANWWSLEPLDRRVYDALFHRRLAEGRAGARRGLRAARVLDRARAELLLVLAPMLVLLAWSEGAAWLTRGMLRALGRGDVPNVLGVPLDELARWLGVPVVIVLGPGLLRWAWRATPLGEGELRGMIAQMLARYRVRVSGPLVWHTGSVNAAVLGVMPPMRYLLITDALLERLDAGEVESVLAHEIAHVKHHHLAWLAGAMLAMVLALGWLLELVEVVLAWALHAHAWDAGARVALAAMHSTGGAGAIAIVTLALALLWFGVVSRRFEWEADAFSAAHCSGVGAIDARGGASGAIGETGAITPEGARRSAGTLLSVARENLTPPERPSWRHGSIRVRCERILQLADDGPAGDRERRRLRGEGRAIRVFAVAVPMLTLAAALAG
jgi:Zn-dependent protease with chaperone function